jgi:hypothetical protein
MVYYGVAMHTGNIGGHLYLNFFIKVVTTFKLYEKDALFGLNIALTV